MPVLQGFSPSNIKYMRQFFGERENFQGDNILAIKGSQLGVDKSLVKNSIRSIRQLPIGELTNADINAFGEIGFTHHIQVFRSAGYNLLINSSIFIRLQALVAIEERHSKFKFGLYSLWKAFPVSLQVF